MFGGRFDVMRARAVCNFGTWSFVRVEKDLDWTAARWIVLVFSRSERKFRSLLRGSLQTAGCAQMMFDKMRRERKRERKNV